MISRQTHFEDLIIYQRSVALAKQIYKLTRETQLRSDRGLTDQIRRASVSVLSNIAEGYERGSNAELIQFLYISKGSCGEVRAQISLATELGFIDRETGNQLIDNCRSISAMIANMISSLKQSNFRGTKFRYVRPDRAKEAKEFYEEFLREQAKNAKGLQTDQKD